MKILAFKIEDELAEFIKYLDKNLNELNTNMNFQNKKLFFRNKSEICRYFVEYTLKKEKVFNELFEKFKNETQ